MQNDGPAILVILFTGLLVPTVALTSLLVFHLFCIACNRTVLRNEHRIKDAYRSMFKQSAKSGFDAYKKATKG